MASVRTTFSACTALKIRASPLEKKYMAERMYCGVVIALLTWLPGVWLFAGKAPAGDDETLDFARRAAVQALTFQQGDRLALAAAHRLFTDEGWKLFLRSLEGSLDPSGVPTFSSSFVASRKATVLDEKDAVLHIVSETLVQSNNLGKTTYRAAMPRL